MICSTILLGYILLCNKYEVGYLSPFIQQARSIVLIVHGWVPLVVEGILFSNQRKPSWLLLPFCGDYFEGCARMHVDHPVECMLERWYSEF